MPLPEKMQLLLGARIKEENSEMVSRHPWPGTLPHISVLDPPQHLLQHPCRSALAKDHSGGSTDVRTVGG